MKDLIHWENSVGRAACGAVLHHDGFYTTSQTNCPVCLSLLEAKLNQQLLPQAVELTPGVQVKKTEFESEFGLNACLSLFEVLQAQATPDMEVWIEKLGANLQRVAIRIFELREQVAKASENTVREGAEALKRINNLKE